MGQKDPEKEHLMACQPAEQFQILATPHTIHVYATLRTYDSIGGHTEHFCAWISRHSLLVRVW